jgi:hypothetical protein
VENFEAAVLPVRGIFRIDAWFCSLSGLQIFSTGLWAAVEMFLLFRRNFDGFRLFADGGDGG